MANLFQRAKQRPYVPEKYISKLHAISGRGDYFFPEVHFTGSAEIGEKITTADEAWFKFLEKQLSSSKFFRRWSKTKILVGTAAAVWLGFRLSGWDDHHNTIEGLNEQGLAAQQRKILTDFGSGYDRVRSIAASLNVTFESLTKSKGWRNALSAARELKKIGEGKFATAHLMETEFQGETIQFVRKKVKGTIKEILAGAKHPEKYQSAFDLRHEAEMMSPFGATEVVPSVYGASEKEMFMEYMPGVNLAALYKSGGQLTESAKRTLFDSVEHVAGQGIINLDVHHGNILFDPKTGRVSWIDWGLAQRTEESMRLAGMRMEERVTPFLTPVSPASFQQRTKPPIGAGKVASMSEVTKSTSVTRATTATKVDGMPHGSVAARKRQISTDFSSPWKGLFGSISRKITKYMGRAVNHLAPKLLDPRKAAKLAEGKTLEQFAKAIHARGFIARDVQGEAIFAQLAEKMPEVAAGAAAIPLKGQSSIVMSPRRLQEAFYNHATQHGLSSDIAQKAVMSEDFLKTVFYHEFLEQQAGNRFAKLVSMPAKHRASQVLIGEGGFVSHLRDDNVKQLFATIRKVRREEHAAFSAGIEAFQENGVSASLRRLTTDFGSGYRGLLDGKSVKITKDDMVETGRAAVKLIESSRDLRMAQEKLWHSATYGGKYHGRRMHGHVKQLSRFGAM